MFEKIIKLIPLAIPLIQFLLNRNSKKQFLRLTKLETSQLSFYSQFMRKDDIVFNIGANVGIRSILFLKLGANVVVLNLKQNYVNI